MSARGDARARAAERLLAEEGFDGAAVSAEGREGEIAAIRVSAGAWARLVGGTGARVAERVRGLGFRYVALDLLPTDG